MFGLLSLSLLLLVSTRFGMCACLQHIVYTTYIHVETSRVRFASSLSGGGGGGGGMSPSPTNMSKFVLIDVWSVQKRTHSAICLCGRLGGRTIFRHWRLIVRVCVCVPTPSKTSDIQLNLHNRWLRNWTLCLCSSNKHGLNIWGFSWPPSPTVRRRCESRQRSTSKWKINTGLRVEICCGTVLNSMGFSKKNGIIYRGHSWMTPSINLNYWRKLKC